MSDDSETNLNAPCSANLRFPHVLVRFTVYVSQIRDFTFIFFLFVYRNECNLDLVTDLSTDSFVSSNKIITKMTVYIWTGYENSILSYFSFRHWSKKIIK